MLFFAALVNYSVNTQVKSAFLECMMVDEM